MELHPAGNTWLQFRFGLARVNLIQHSFVSSRETTTYNSDGTIEKTFGPKYAPEPNVWGHLEFSLKNERLNLDFLTMVCQHLTPKDVGKFVDEKPAGRYRRKLGFLYEMLTGYEVKKQKEVTGNYVDLLDEDQYYTGSPEKVARWRINNNLPGNREFCPLVYRTPQLDAILNTPFRTYLDNLGQQHAPQLFFRGINYFYFKETRSSYSIEHENPSTERMNRFVALLQQAGQSNAKELLLEANLVKWQQVVLEPRYASTAFRDYQNYVGQSLPNFQELVHYVCPPPALLTQIMAGMQSMVLRISHLHPIVQAAFVSFAFVFAHPFEDGNGRLHRFLIHDMLSRGGLVPEGMIVPVSAHILARPKEYNAILEAYNKPLMERVRYAKTPEGELQVKNDTEVASYYRYPDLTVQTQYLASIVAETIMHDMPVELDFLLRYDQFKQSLREVVDMPDRKLDLMITLLHQNNGKLAKRRRKQFEELTEAEVSKMESLYIEVFDNKVREIENFKSAL
jgi:hypothetical protein